MVECPRALDWRKDKLCLRPELYRMPLPSNEREGISDEEGIFDSPLTDLRPFGQSASGQVMKGT